MPPSRNLQQNQASQINQTAQTTLLGKYSSAVLLMRTTLLMLKNYNVIFLANELDKLNGLEKEKLEKQGSLEGITNRKNDAREELITLTINEYPDIVNYQYKEEKLLITHLLSLPLDSELIKLLATYKQYWNEEKATIKEIENILENIQTTSNNLQSNYKNVKKDSDGWYCVFNNPWKAIYGKQSLLNELSEEDKEKIKKGDSPSILHDKLGKPIKVDYVDSIRARDKDIVLKTIAEKLDNGQEISPELWAYFYNMSRGEVGKLYNKIMDIYMEGNNKFRYNINTSLDATLVDIRNYRNFRNSNLGKAGVKVYGGTVLNPSVTNEVCASRSFYMSQNDFYWSLNYRSVSGLGQSIQNIILNEYQPHIHYNMGALIGAALDDVGGKVINWFSDTIKNKMGNNAGSVFLNFGSQIAKAGAIKVYNDKLDKISINPSALFDLVNDKVTTNPMYFVLHMFAGGIWLNTYELPFINKTKVLTNYLPETKGGDWLIGGLAQAGKNDGAMQKVLQGRISMNIPTSPTFLMNNPQAAVYDSFNISFYLINKNDYYLGKNFEFLHALFAGTNWLTMDMGFVVATNVYNVYVPGRFMIHWAKVGMKVDAVGKLRYNEYMYAKYNNQEGMKSIEEDTMWPLAWDVTLTITPLSQWNFNTYIDYFKHGFGYRRRKRIYDMKESVWDNPFSYFASKQLAEGFQTKVESAYGALLQNIERIREIDNELMSIATNNMQSPLWWEISAQKIQSLYQLREQLVRDTEARIADLRQYKKLFDLINPDNSIDWEQDFGLAATEKLLAKVPILANIQRETIVGGTTPISLDEVLYTDVTLNPITWLERLFFDPGEAQARDITIKAHNYLKNVKAILGKPDMKDEEALEILRKDSLIISVLISNYSRNGFSNREAAEKSFYGSPYTMSRALEKTTFMKLLYDKGNGGDFNLNEQNSLQLLVNRNDTMIETLTNFVTTPEGNKERITIGETYNPRMKKNIQEKVGQIDRAKLNSETPMTSKQDYLNKLISYINTEILAYQIHRRDYQTDEEYKAAEKARDALRWRVVNMVLDSSNKEHYYKSELQDMGFL